MKYIPLFLLLLCFGTSSASGPKGFTLPTPKVEIHKCSSSMLAVKRQAVDTGFFKRDPELYRIEKKVHSGRVMTTAGASMLAASPILLLAGYGCTVATTYAQNETAFAFGLTGSIFFYATGVGCLVAGIPLTVIGAIRWNEGKYERRLYTGTATLQPRIGPATAGLTLTF